MTPLRGPPGALDVSHVAEPNTFALPVAHIADQRQGFLPAPTKHQGVATLQAQHPLAPPGELHQPGTDLALLDGRLVAALASIFKHRAGAGEAQNLWPHQRIVNNHVGVRQGIDHMQRQQPRVARAGASQPHPAGLEGRQCQGWQG